MPYTTTVNNGRPALFWGECAMFRRSLVLLALLLAMAMAVTGCGRYTEAAKESETPDAGSPAPVTKSPEPSAEPPAPGNSPEPVGELTPFAESRDHILVYGYMDKAGNVVIRPQYGSAQPFFACGLAVAGDGNGKLGLIDRTGRFVVSPEADAITYSGGVFIAYNYDGVNRAYDERGVLLFERSDYIFGFSDGLSPVYGENTRGYMDRNGNMVLVLPHAVLEDFQDGVATVSMEYGDTSILIDKQGNDLTDNLSSGLRMIEDNGLFGYTDKDGNTVIEPRFNYARPFRDGLAIVGIYHDYHTTYGIIDTQGNYVLEPEYLFIRRMRNGSFIVGERLEEGAFVPPMYADYCKKAVFSRDLKWHSEWIMLGADSLDENYVCVTDGSRIFYLDADLNRAADLPEFEGRGLMLADGSLLRGTINGHPTVADRAGNILVKDEGLALMEGGVRARTVTEYYNDWSTVAYPVLEEMKDAGIQERMNRMIAEEARGYVDCFEPDPGDPYHFPVINVSGSALVKKDLLHLQLGIDEYWLGAAHPAYYWSNVYVNITNGAAYTLDDLFKSPEEARTRLSEKVTEAMRENPGPYYEDSVRPDQIQFFCLEDDGITIYFAEYEIAPHAYGLPKFYIPFSEIMDLIDTRGDFWKAFN